MQVILLPKVLRYLEDLAEILYEKGYFSFEETSLTYVLALYDDIVSNLPAKQHKPAPNHFDVYGKNMKYAAFRKNKHTTWYAFFKTYEENGQIFYLVRYISNNHVIAQYL
jgi:hypothetical protein